MIAAAAVARKAEERSQVAPRRPDIQLAAAWQMWTEFVYYEIESGQTKSGRSAFDKEPKLLADSRFCL